jgi:hypothetical protein
MFTFYLGNGKPGDSEVNGSKFFQVKYVLSLFVYVIVVCVCHSLTHTHTHI